MVDKAFEIRNDSDYDDMYIASKDESRGQIENAERILDAVVSYLNKEIGE